MLTFLVTGDVCVAVTRYVEVDTSCGTRQVQPHSAPFSPIQPLSHRIKHYFQSDLI